MKACHHPFGAVAFPGAADIPVWEDRNSCSSTHSVSAPQRRMGRRDIPAERCTPTGASEKTRFFFTPLKRIRRGGVFFRQVEHGGEGLRAVYKRGHRVCCSALGGGQVQPLEQLEDDRRLREGGVESGPRFLRWTQPMPLQIVEVGTQGDVVQRLADAVHCVWKR